MATNATPTVMKITLNKIAIKIPINNTLERCCSFTLNESKIKMKTKITIDTSSIKTRVVWGFKPITRVKESKKIYSRKNLKFIY